MLWGVLVILLCYLIGSIPFAVIVSRYAKGIDLRQHGSGNMGATNAARVLGKKWFPVVFGLDFAKGAGAAVLAMTLLPTYLHISAPLAAAIGGTAAVIGHCFPVFAGFRGGVGLAASGGAIAVVSPWLLVVMAIGIVVFWILFRNMYVGVAVTALCYPAMAGLFFAETGVIVTMAVWGLVVFYVHLKDVRIWWEGRRKGA